MRPSSKTPRRGRRRCLGPGAGFLGGPLHSGVIVGCAASEKSLHGTRAFVPVCSRVRHSGKQQAPPRCLQATGLGSASQMLHPHSKISLWALARFSYQVPSACHTSPAAPALGVQSHKHNPPHSPTHAC